MAEEALGRIVAGRTTQDLFAREEIARRIGKASYDSLIKKLHEIQDERMTEMSAKSPGGTRVDKAWWRSVSRKPWRSVGYNSSSASVTASGGAILANSRM